jgi:hypothetical protein
MPGLARNVRFLTSLAPGVLLFVLFIAIVVIVGARFDGNAGVLLGIVAGLSAVIAVALTHAVLVDWLNLRAIRAAQRPGGHQLRDGAVVAVDGVVRVEGEPMVSPFTATRCAAYTYEVSYSKRSGRRRKRVVLAQGFHLMRTRIDGAVHSLRLGSFPGLDSDLRRTEHGSAWSGQARALAAALGPTASSASQRQRQGRLLEVRHTIVDEVHQDYRMDEIGPHADRLDITEEVLPVDQRVCVVGAYDQERRSLTARRSRLGANLIVYRGSADEVMARVSRHNARLVMVIAVTVVIAAGVLIYSLAARSAG